MLGGRARDAAYYPPDLIVEILRGMRADADAELAMAEQEEQQHLASSIANSGFNAPSTRSFSCTA